MKLKEGDRVHVTQLDNMKVDFYATLNRNPANPACFKLEDCSNSTHEEKSVWQIVTNNSCDYYVLSEDEEDYPRLRWSDGTPADGEVMVFEEDTEEPIVQHTTDPVNKPSHYMLGNHEVKDIVSLVADKYHKGSVAHNVASALEYLMRSPDKNGLEDVKKARKCLEFAIENWEE